MRILGIDPGTSCGWALREPGGDMTSGRFNLKLRRHEGAGMRYIKLRASLRDFLVGMPVDLVAYEEVRRHRGTDAAHVYGGLVAVIQSVCEETGTPYYAIPVGAIKKNATGKGNANKQAMIDAAKDRWQLRALTEDEADARWIAETAYEEYGQ